MSSKLIINYFIVKKFVNLPQNRAYLTLRASLLKQQVAFVTGALRHVTAAHEIFIHSLRFDQHSFQMQSQRGGLRELQVFN